MKPTRITRTTTRTGRPIRVLLVDDSVVVRRLVATALEGEARIEVAGTAGDGAAALQRIAQLQPDVVTLDIEMPVLDGLETLRRIRQTWPRLIVIMLSALTERGATATMEALAMGASDYVAKPVAGGSVDSSICSLRAELVPKILQFFEDGGDEVPYAAPLKLPVLTPIASARQILLIGVSTGGPTALARIMPMFPASFPLPVLIVQHMPPVFTRSLAERLNALTPLDVQEAGEGNPIIPGTVLVAPGNYHLRVCRSGRDAVVTALGQDSPENSCRPSVDVTFRSAADLYGGAVIAAVLTGMGQDGMLGARYLHEKGAYVIAQDEASSVVWGMPGAVVAAGIADAVVDLDHVVTEILRQV